ncbi:thymidylate synthase (FAD) [Tindallia magadiensis]|uniref:Flavin-dependent thymidylate synthase n=1 Tax=Tindallia magadiensis TaxID=69895 RepID=A0A1I3HPN5_9FIRM|nr:FAD-dependent thymidylate synthase [Tindallia magadiensis]SFI37694.1 thymidylate synthase (FAD) [Tindallia magadiensis]
MKAQPIIELISHTPDPEKIVAAAAKLCYSPTGATELMKNLEEDSVRHFVTLLTQMGHESPIEHISFTFSVEGVSRSLTHQLVRHRIASYSQQSQRYVREEGFAYIIPSAIEQDVEAKTLFEKTMDAQQKAYDQLAERLVSQYKKEFMAKGLPEKKANSLAEKKAIEDARYVLPNACETKIVITMNARSLLHFFKIRCCNRAQWEIKNLAIEMLRQVKAVAPSIFGKAGPDCVHGTCGEGAMSCGQAQAVSVFFKNL